uniref:CSON011498 protein n=1 Tax=Culicoides sonorensis TaxID=179676 RepID=A0A336LGT2_CULSO
MEEHSEAPVDPGFGSRGYTEQDYEGHRAHTMFFDVHVPNRRSHRRHKVSQRQTSGKGVSDMEKQSSPPAQKVQFILGDEIEIDGESVETHPLFSEMEELVKDGDEIEWKETARWVKFEEDVEEGGNRWSKPHVATLSLHSLFELRSYIMNGSIMLEMEATTLEQVVDLVCENMVNNNLLSSDLREKVRDALLKRHRHQHEQARKNHMTKLPLIRSLADIGKNHSTAKSFFRTPPQTSVSCTVLPNESEPILSIKFKQSNIGSKDKRGVYSSVPSGECLATSPTSISMQRNSSSGDLDEKHKTNINFMRKIPPGAEASNILVGEVEFLQKSISAFVRLNNAYILGDLTEVPVPTRFIFLLLGPPGSQNSFHEVGRAMATLMSDEVFHEVAYRAKKREHLIAGIDEFLDAVTVLPPGEWDPSIRIEPPASVPSQDVRKKPDKQNKKEEISEEEHEQKLREESGLSRTGILFDLGVYLDKQQEITLRPWKVYYQSINGTLVGLDCNKPEFVSDVFLMSLILFAGTYIISVVLKDFKNALFFPSGVRQVISDFAVIIAILSMTIFDYTTNVKTPKLQVPNELKPTLPNRGWVIAPFHKKNPIWSSVLAILPALLGTILIFMDQQITAVIVNRKENKLKKGCGYHLDLFVLAGLILICSIMGLPWFVAATVLSINHVNSLKVESETAAPGEKPQFLGVREQRATHIMIFITIGCSVLLTPLLSHVSTVN